MPLRTELNGDWIGQSLTSEMTSRTVSALVDHIGNSVHVGSSLRYQF
ncbi:hypothetical protein [Bradyrhizobium sp. 2TAF24]